jgi:hypothetical protein
VNYVTIYDASHQAPPWLGLATGLLLLVIGVAVWRSRKKEDVVGKLISGIVITGSSCTAIFLLASTYSTYSEVQRIFNEGKASVVEGTVENLKLTAAGKAESFTVAGTQFEYSEYSDSFGFHHTSAFGGPIRDGLAVRISYAPIVGDPSDPVILKLEVRK